MKLKQTIIAAMSLPLTACAVATTSAEVGVPTSTTSAVTTTEVATTTTAPPTTTTYVETTTTLPIEVSGFKCPDQMVIAYEVGWPEMELARLDKIVYRESRCDSSAHNTEDPSTGSRGLTQINGFWCRYDSSWLEQQGVLGSCEELFDPATNLIAALAIWHRSGWAPWGG